MATTSIEVGPERLSALIGLGYEAPLVRPAWRVFAEEATAVLNCPLAMVEYCDEQAPERSFVATSGPPGFEEAFIASRAQSDEDDVYAIDIRCQTTGTVRLAAEIVPPHAMRQTRTYSRLARPWQLEHFLFGAIITGAR